jgi:NAD(P)-dependent dehydrogenase (short-subunit alcohol dehydrogenase family)
MPYPNPLKVAITGAGGGIGRATALHLASHGWIVAISDLDGSAAQTVADEVCAAGGQATAHELDVTDHAAVEAWVAEVDDHLDGLSGAVANAGVIRIQPFLELTPKVWREVMSVNLDGTFHFVHPVAARMATRGGGSIVIVASASSRIASLATNVYNTSKTALHGLTRAMALELGPLGVRVNAVSPGIVDTPMWELIDRERAALLGKKPGEVIAEAVSRIPLGRVGKPEDVAKFIRYLLSEDADYMTGQNISYDGGFVMP